MFLKIMSENKNCQHEAFYECKTIRTKQKKELLLFILENDENDNVTRVVVDGKEEAQIYIMNHEGKTIEHISWRPKQEESGIPSK